MSNIASVCVADDEVPGGERVLVRGFCIFCEDVGCVGRKDHVRGEREVGVIVVNVGKAYAPGRGFWGAVQERGFDLVSFVLAAGCERCIKFGLKRGAGLVLNSFLEEVAELPPICTW